MSRNLAMLIEYDGSDFHGWQRQPRERTVAGTIEHSLAPLLGHDLTIIGAGRTDRGVHAAGQVANFRTSSSRPARELLVALNATLPHDVTVRDVQDVADSFHARYSAKSRRYRYRVSLRRRSIGSAYCWVVTRPLNVDRMAAAARLLVGRWDFGSFCTSPPAEAALECTVSQASWDREPQYLRFEIEADRFLHRMVRSLVGTLVDVGLGRTGVDEFAALLHERARDKAGPTAPARGLTLQSIRYSVAGLFAQEKGESDEAVSRHC